jgi:hypothetical protein
MFDAVNAIEGRYRPYLAQPVPPVTADARAAAAAAAHGVLVRLVPAQQAALAAALAASLAPIPDGPEKTEGIAAGARAAELMVAHRATDNFLLPNPVYVPRQGPAAYQLTPPAFNNPINQNAARFVPFVMGSSDRHRPNGPPRLASQRFVEEYDEVRALGRACGASESACPRTPEQTMIATWHTEQAQVQMSRIARILAAPSGMDLLDTARVFARLSMAMLDAVISVFEAKYAYHFVRPVTAIRAGDTDGVDGTVGEPGWTPLFATPPHPEYPSAHAVIQAAGGEILKKAFGRHASFETTSTTVPGLVRLFDDVDAFVADGQVARIYGGMHFRTAVEEGAKQGRKVGKDVAAHALRPVE